MFGGGEVITVGSAGVEEDGGVAEVGLTFEGDFLDERKEASRSNGPGGGVVLGGVDGGVGSGVDNLAADEKL